MKIKAVCELTGLTDRTIRYYIEQELISPHFTENYLGRKTFDFSLKDIQDLNDIATLRKFDFSIQEIRDIISSPDNSKKIIENVKSRITQALEENQEKLSVLIQLDSEKTYTVSELADQLTHHASALPLTNENYKRNFAKVLLSALKAVITFVIVWFPIFLSLFMFVLRFARYDYPCFNTDFKVYIILFLALLPSITVLIISKFHFPLKKILKAIALVLCIFSLPFCLFMPLTTITHSETTHFINYRDFDSDCLANRSMFFQELFPLWPRYFENVKQPDGTYESVDLDAHYYYRYLEVMDYTFDIYAEWPLEKEEFDKEVTRVKALFDEHKPTEDLDSENCPYVEVKKGNYNCLILYDTYCNSKPFEEVKDNYRFYIFAYDETNLKVRYIFCASLENGADQPYYLQLDW